MLMCLYIQLLNLEISSETLYLFPPLVWDTSTCEWRPKINAKLSYSAAYVAFKKLLCKFSLDPSKFALHSPRIGGTIGMFQNKVPKRLIDRQGRWKNRKTKYRYAPDDIKNFVKHLKVHRWMYPCKTFVFFMIPDNGKRPKKWNYAKNPFSGFWSNWTSDLQNYSSRPSYYYCV